MEIQINKDKKYGNDQYWIFISSGWNEKKIAVWRKNIDGGEVIAHAKDKYEAKLIIDALLNYTVKDIGALGKKELAFLEFVCSNCVEPYATMASNTIMWNDREAYEKLKNDFPTIYS